uniref:Secreted protein n=1 Tax=Rhipicephalus appendiculatus TaxID=34631 RepID=A0A131YDH5_RHIAP
MISQLRILVPLCVRLPTAEGAHTYSRQPRSSRPPPSPGGAAGRLGRKATAAAACHVGGTRPGRPLCRLKERMREARENPTA